MSEPLVEVNLYGALAERFGARHYFAVATPGEAARALCANFPGFRDAFLKAAPAYSILADGSWRGGPEAALLSVSREVHFVPRAAGADPGTLTTIGIQILVGLAVSAALAGISYLLNPPGSDAEKEAEDKSESYVFTGGGNVAEQGATVPVIYGRVHVGSVVVSAGLVAADQVAYTQTEGTGTGPTRYNITQPPDEPNPNAPRGGDLPEIKLQKLGPPDARIRRLGPVGWNYYGARSLHEDGKTRVLDIFVSPDGVAAWDYWRGFGLYSERVFLP